MRSFVKIWENCRSSDFKKVCRHTDIHPDRHQSTIACYKLRGLLAKKLVSARLTQYLLMHGNNATAMPSSERMWNNGCQKEELSIEENHIFCSPSGTPGAIATQCPRFSQSRSAVSEDIRPKQTDTDRQTHMHTNSELNIPHYHEEMTNVICCVEWRSEGFPLGWNVATFPSCHPREQVTFV